MKELDIKLNLNDYLYTDVIESLQKLRNMLRAHKEANHNTHNKIVANLLQEAINQHTNYIKRIRGY